MIKDKYPSIVHGSSRTVDVLQSLADHDPDVDAIYRLTRPVPFDFSRQGMVVSIPIKTNYAPFNAQAALFQHRAFWGLLLPVTVHGRVADIWRSYILERLFRDSGMNVAFSSSWVNQFRNSHNYLGDFQSETNLYLQSGELVKLLDTWVCESRTLFHICFQDLYVFLYEHGILEEADVMLVSSWIRDLLRLGYRFPVRRES